MIALFALAPLSTAEVAGTASTTFVATGLLGSLVYFQSGEFAQGHAREMAIVLSTASVFGALAGSRLNFLLPEAVFGYLLSAFVATIGAVIVFRERVGLKPSNRIDAVPAQQRRILFGTIGFGIGILGGLLGVGGPVVAVPVLVVLGVPMLVAVAVAQVQSIFISAFAAASYATAGAVSVPVALLVGVPQLVGVVAGWKVAHLVDPGRLRVVLGVVLIVVAPILLL